MSEAAEAVAAAYTVDWVKSVEKFYGVGFLSAGGETICRDLVRHLKIKAGDSVLDLGSGIGGTSFYIASTGATTTGVEYSKDLVALANERVESMGLSGKVTFIQKDITKVDFEPESFDGIVSWGVFGYLKYEDHVPVLKKMQRWLKHGGRVVIQNVIKFDTPAASSKECKDYQRKTNFENLVTYSDYQQSIQDSGLELVEFENRREFYIQDTSETLAKVLQKWDEISKEVPEETLERTVEFWREKLKWAEEGAINACLFVLEKP